MGDEDRMPPPRPGGRRRGRENRKHDWVRHKEMPLDDGTLSTFTIESSISTRGQQQERELYYPGVGSDDYDYEAEREAEKEQVLGPPKAKPGMREVKVKGRGETRRRDADQKISRLDLYMDMSEEVGQTKERRERGRERERERERGRERGRERDRGRNRARGRSPYDDDMDDMEDFSGGEGAGNEEEEEWARSSSQNSQNSQARRRKIHRDRDRDRDRDRRNPPRRRKKKNQLSSNPRNKNEVKDDVPPKYAGMLKDGVPEVIVRSRMAADGVVPPRSFYGKSGGRDGQRPQRNRRRERESDYDY